MIGDYQSKIPKDAQRDYGVAIDKTPIFYSMIYNENLLVAHSYNFHLPLVNFIQNSYITRPWTKQSFTCSFYIISSDLF